MSGLYEKGIFTIKEKGLGAEASRAVKKEASRAEFKRGAEDEPSLDEVSLRLEFENAAQAVVFQHYMEQVYETLATVTSGLFSRSWTPSSELLPVRKVSSTTFNPQAPTSARTSSSSSFRACRSLRCTCRLFKPSRTFSAFL